MRDRIRESSKVRVKDGSKSCSRMQKKEGEREKETGRIRESSEVREKDGSKL